MNLKIVAVLLISNFFTFNNITLAQTAKRAKSLSELQGLFETKRGLENYNSEMNGILKEDKLGIKLPKGMSAKEIIQLVAPKEKAKNAIVVGAKAFPYRSNTYGVIVCFGRFKNEYERATSQKSCEKDVYDRDDIVYVGLIEFTPSKSKLRLVAEPIQVKTNWRFIIPEQFRSGDRKERVLLPSGIYSEFDFAAFKVTDTQTAFGLRVGSNTGYAGGFGYFETLTLFMIDGDRIVNIFSEPIFYFQNLAGSWNKDGTREHFLKERENVLVVLPSKTNGYFNLQVKSLDSEWQQIFTWNTSQKRYLSIN